MNKKILILVAGMLIFSTVIFAQPWMSRSMGENKKVIIQLRNLELLKILDLTEEQSMKVLPIIKDIDKLMSEFYDSHHQVMKDLETALVNNNKKAVTKNIDKLLQQDVELDKQKAALHKKLRERLSEDKFARYLLFMQKFGRDLQDKIKMMKEGNKFQGHSKDFQNK